MHRPSADRSLQGARTGPKPTPCIRDLQQMPQGLHVLPQRPCDSTARALLTKRPWQEITVRQRWPNGHDGSRQVQEVAHAVC
jgi:hypothetical protein